MPLAHFVPSRPITSTNPTTVERRSQKPPDAAIMVGDTATDYLAAQAAGYKGFVTIADTAPIKPDFIPHTDAVLASVADLPNILLQNGA